ncbi:MAG: hypothetical protein JSV56_03130, partial [Methanomassiliicoccales archaeon]
MNYRLSLIKIVYSKKLRIAIVILLLFSLVCPILLLDIPVKLIENASADPPIVMDITPSSNEAYIHHYIYFYINATDREDNEEDLTVMLEWRTNNSYDDDPPSDPSWGTDPDKITISQDSYYGSSPSGWLRVKFQPDLSAWKGRYDVRAKVIDTDGNYSRYIHLMGKIKVTNMPYTE